MSLPVNEFSTCHEETNLHLEAEPHLARRILNDNCHSDWQLDIFEKMIKEETLLQLHYAWEAQRHIARRCACIDSPPMKIEEEDMVFLSSLETCVENVVPRTICNVLEKEVDSAQDFIEIEKVDVVKDCG